MTTTASTAFYSQVAAAIFGYKHYLTTEEFMRVAMSISNCYKSMSPFFPNVGVVEFHIKFWCKRVDDGAQDQQNSLMSPDPPPHRGWGLGMHETTVYTCLFPLLFLSFDN